MNEFLQYLLNSAICLSTLYLLFRVLMRKEAYFKLNRIVLLSIVLCSLVIPKLIMPQFIQQTVHQPIEMQLPVFILEDNNLQKLPASDETVLRAKTIESSKTQEKFSLSHFSIQEMLFYAYITGLLITFLTLVFGLISIFNLYRKAEVIRMDGFRLLILDKEIAAFSFGKLVFISQSDYNEHGQVILAHEKEHIRFGHFYDLFFLEVIKIVFWFNPFIYWLIRDMKDIHEFEADDQTLTKGIDATKYQLLIIQKSVGPEKFALANSFNHCQIKNRIAMINKLKTGKAWCWKVAIFLPLLALLLIFCGRKVSSVPSDQNKQANQLDTIIHGKRLFVKDTTQYASSFIKELKDSWVGYETLLVKDDSFLITSRSSTGKKDTVVSYQYTIPTNLELNKEIVFSTKNKDKYLVLKRTNYTNIEYQVKNEKKEKIKSGTAILQSTFYFGAEMDHDENGQEIASIQYLNLNSDLDWAAITIELYDAKIASINYCVDPKTKKYERLSQLLRVPFDQNKNIPPPTVINIDIKKEGVYLKENLVTLDEFRKQLPLVVKNYPQSNILVNIIDKNNPDIQAIQNILKETGVAFGKPGENDRSSVDSNLPTEQPRVLRQLKLIKPQTKVAASRAITLILDKDNSVYYYEGAPDKKTGIDPVVTKTDLNGIHRYLTKKNKDIIREVQQLRNKKEVFNLSENDFEKQRKEIISGKTALVVVVKSTNATQENISTILDEMERYQFYHYALFDVTDYDRSLMTNARVELNPPAFSLKKQK